MQIPSGRVHFWTLVLLFTAGWVFPILAQSNPVALRGGIGFSTTSFDKEVVDAHNLVDRSFGIQGTFAPRFYNYLGILAEVGWEYLGQVCLDLNQDIDCTRDKTSTSAFFASIGAGLATPMLVVGAPGERVGIALALFGGTEWVSAGLGEDNCLNCQIEDLDVRGGLYIEPGLEIAATPNVVVGFHYRIYEDAADLGSRFALRIVHSSN